MEYLWRSYGASPEHHRSSALAALVQVACATPGALERMEHAVEGIGLALPGL
jgi:hypothetical protein